MHKNRLCRILITQQVAHMLIRGPTLMLTHTTGKGRVEERSLIEFSDGEPKENFRLSCWTLDLLVVPPECTPSHLIIAHERSATGDARVTDCCCDQTGRALQNCCKASIFPHCAVYVSKEHSFQIEISILHICSLKNSKKGPDLEDPARKMLLR